MDYKPQDPVYDWMDFDKLPAMGHSLVYNGDFALGDNFRDLVPDWESRPKDSDPKYREPFPVRINFILLLTCTDGWLDVQLNLQDFHLVKGDFLIASPGDVCVFKQASPDESLEMFTIAIGNKDYLDMRQREMAIDLRTVLTSCRVFHLKEEDLLAFQSFYRMMGRKLQDASFGHKADLIRSYLSLMAVYARQWLDEDSRSKPAQSRQEALFQQFMEELSRHFREEHDVAFYADKLCITPKYLSQLVHQVSGKFASEWIREHILLEAKALLRADNHTILQISERLNFPNPSFFSQFFKRYTGLTPKQYRNQ
ncbi:MAG: AraC family transcriptional regulator [Bacteroidales bacterium]|nr:AraC family transcriptional regulator [Bacteroidales bacterium]